MKNSLLKVASIILLPSQSIGSTNEFTLLAEHFDFLYDAGTNCDIEFTEEATAIFCENGFIGMTNTVDYINATEWEPAELMVELSGMPRDVRVGELISVVDP